jgi:hypothetical protein
MQAAGLDVAGSHLSQSSQKSYRTARMQLGAAVITAPRSVSYLAQTAQSLVVAGAERLHVFAEPATDLQPLHHVVGCPISLVQRSTRRGNFRNWMEAARHMLELDNEYILMCEDDVLFGRTSIGDGLAACSMLVNVGFVSLYTPTHYQRLWRVLDANGKWTGKEYESKATAQSHATGGGRTVVPRDFETGVYAHKFKSLYGALGLLFHRDMLARVVDHDIAKFWKDRYRQLPSEKLACVDTCIGEIMQVLQKDCYFFNPSRAQHIGEISSLDPLKVAKEFRVSSNVLL